MTYAPGPAAIVFAHVCFTLIYGSYQRPPASKEGGAIVWHRHTCECSRSAWRKSEAKLWNFENFSAWTFGIWAGFVLQYLRIFGRKWRIYGFIIFFEIWSRTVHTRTISLNAGPPPNCQNATMTKWRTLVTHVPAFHCKVNSVFLPAFVVHYFWVPRLLTG